MKEWLVFLTENAVVLIDFMALAIIVFGTLEAFYRQRLRRCFRRRRATSGATSGCAMRAGWSPG